MRKLAMLVMLLVVAGCAHMGTPTTEEDRTKELSRVEVTLSDFSKTITAYYGARGSKVGDGFDEKQFFAILETDYPDQSKVAKIKIGFTVKARPVDGGYSVMLCDRQTGNKLMEDFSCHLTRVELRLWDKDGNYPCAFEQTWKPLCE